MNNTNQEYNQPLHKPGDIVFIASRHGPLQLPVHSITHLHTKDGLDYFYTFEGYTSVPANQVANTLRELAEMQAKYWINCLIKACDNG
jgi:hypothetical protein